jgi:hypothetical protein
VGAIGLSRGAIVASKPANEKLYAMIVAQAKAKYSNYPNPGASHWVHERYIQSGGKFIDTTEDSRRKDMIKKAFVNKRKKEAATEKTKKTVKKDKKKDK